MNLGVCDLDADLLGRLVGIGIDRGRQLHLGHAVQVHGQRLFNRFQQGMYGISVLVGVKPPR